MAKTKLCQQWETKTTKLQIKWSSASTATTKIVVLDALPAITAAAAAVATGCGGYIHFTVFFGVVQ